MGKILLDYAFPITEIEPTPAGSTAFLKQVCVVAKPKTGQESNVGQLFECTSMTQVAARTDNDNAEQLFAAGMTRVYILLSDDLDLATSLLQVSGVAWTVLISDDFTDADLDVVVTPAVAASRKIQDILYTAKTPGTAGNAISIEYVDTNTGGAASASVSGSVITVSIEAGVTMASAIAVAIASSGAANALVATAVDAGDETDPQVVAATILLIGGSAETSTSGELSVGSFDGMIGFSSSDAAVAQEFGTAPKRVGFFRLDANGAGNMFFAFGSMLSNLLNWTNQQYISMPFNDGIDELGEANSLFDDRVSFVLNDTQFGNRLALFVAGGKAIVAPYIKKNLQIDLQSRALQWIAANQPQYTLTNAALLETRLQEDVIKERYIETKWIDKGTVEIKLEQDNFVASGYIDISEPSALWRIFGEMRSTL